MTTHILQKESVLSSFPFVTTHWTAFILNSRPPYDFVAHEMEDPFAMPHVSLCHWTPSPTTSNLFCIVLSSPKTLSFLVFCGKKNCDFRRCFCVCAAKPAAKDARRSLRFEPQIFLQFQSLGTPGKSRKRAQKNLHGVNPLFL